MIHIYSDGSIYRIESISTIFCRIETYRNRRYFPGHQNDFGTHQLGPSISCLTRIKHLSQSRQWLIIAVGMQKSRDPGHGRLDGAIRRGCWGGGGRGRRVGWLCMAGLHRVLGGRLTYASRRRRLMLPSTQRLPSIVERGGDAMVV